MNSYRPEISQEEFEEIENYLLGNLTVSQRQDFENRLQSDSTLQSEVKLQQKLISAVELGSYKKEPKISPISKSKTKKLYLSRVWIVAAACVGFILISFFTFQFLRKTTSYPMRDLYESYFYPEYGLPVVMGTMDENEYDFNLGMVKYKENKYQDAINIWSKLLYSSPESDTLNYFLGVAHLNLDQFSESISNLEEVLLNPQSNFYSKALWYRALIHVHQNELEPAIDLIEGISDDSRADSLLINLKNLK